MSPRRQHHSKTSEGPATLVVEEQIRDGCRAECHGHREKPVDGADGDKLAKILHKATTKCCSKADKGSHEVNETTAIDVGKRNPNEWPNSVEGNADCAEKYVLV